MDDVIKESDALKPEIQRYANCMIEIKNRCIAIKELFEVNFISKENMGFAAEFGCLQLRSIAELIILANFSAHEKHYDIAKKALVDFWVIREIIDKIKKINPDYYPVPTELDLKQIPERPDVAGYVTFEKSTSPLSEKDLLEMYNATKKYVHPNSPFAPPRDYLNIIGRFKPWVANIQALLKSHTIQLVGANKKLFTKVRFDVTAETDITIAYMSEVPKRT
jgi:hypothetical protein